MRNYLVVAEPDGDGRRDRRRGLRGRKPGRRRLSARNDFAGGSAAWRPVAFASRTPTAPRRRFRSGAAKHRVATVELSQRSRRRCGTEDPCARPMEDGSDPYSFLMRECGLDRRGAEQAAEYVRAGRAALGAMPTHAAPSSPSGSSMKAAACSWSLHAPFGARINRAWGLALRKRFCRSFNFELQAAATDNGIVISLSEQHAFPLESFSNSCASRLSKTC